MLYNFRYDRNSRGEVLNRINGQNLLCQGWGGGEERDLNMAKFDTWEYREQTRDYYDLSSTRIPSNLSRIRDFKDGDLLVVPHLPENGKVSVLVVDGDFPNCYDYKQSDLYHLNNQISVKPDKKYGLDGNISIYHAKLAPWYGKLQWMRLPILPKEEYTGIFTDICHQLDENSSKKYEPSVLDDYFSSAVIPGVLDAMNVLQDINPSGGEISFEKVCQYLLEKSGYRIDGGNIYDGQGGDIDLLCKKNRSDTSPFESGETTLFVQVKKHEGTTDGWAVEQLCRMMKEQPEADADGCVMTLADDYTDNAKELAHRNGIHLLNGRDIKVLLLQVISGQLTVGDSE